MLTTLLRKQFQEDFRFLKQDKKEFDWWGAVFSLMLIALAIGVEVVLLIYAINTYIPIKVSGVENVAARQFELLTLIYGLIIVISILSGARAIRLTIFDNPDILLYKVLPIAPLPMFLSKIVSIYIKQVLMSMLYIIPINLTFGIVADVSVGYVFATIFSCFTLPLVTLLFSLLLSFPAHLLRKLIGNRYIISMLILTVITGLVFWGYSELITFFETLVETGDIKYFFNQDLMMKIINVTNNLYPANVFAALLVGKEIGKNVGILIGSMVGFCAIAVPLMGVFLKYSIDHNNGDYVKPVAVQYNFQTNKKSIVESLFKKELLTVFRTPSYMFAYFTMPIIMPVMVYFCTKMGADLIGNLSLINCNFQMSLTVIMIFVVLCNVFAATNISREGLAFFTMKAMPISFKQILGVKIGFCSIISLFGTFISVIVVGATGYLTAEQAIYVFVCAALFGEAQIIFATRKDFNHPHFLDKGDVTEQSATASETIIIGMIVAVVLGASSIVATVYGGLAGTFDYVAYTYSVFMIIPLALFIGSLIYMFIGLEKKYEIISETI